MPNHSLLCAEDNTLSRQMICEYFEDDFEHIYEAKDGKEALALYYEKKPSIIISDIEMPELDGLSLVREIRKKDKETPIIMLTAYSDTEYLLDAVELNLVKYLLKPLDDVKLDLAMKECLQIVNVSDDIPLSSEHSYNITTSTLTHKNVAVPLAHSVDKFLRLLIKNRHQTVPYEQIASEVWGDKIMTDSALRSLIHNLRKSIHPKIISNVSKKGYSINLYE